MRMEIGIRFHCYKCYGTVKQDTDREVSTVAALNGDGQRKVA